MQSKTELNIKNIKAIIENKTQITEFTILSSTPNHKHNQDFYVQCKIARKIKALEIYLNNILKQYDEYKKAYMNIMLTYQTTKYFVKRN